MKKIFNFGLALAVVAAMALVGCSGGGSLDLDTGIGGDSSIEKGAFKAGWDGVGLPKDTIAAKDSMDTNGEAKIIKFADGDALKVFNGRSTAENEKEEIEDWLDGPRSLSYPRVDNYNVNYTYYDVKIGGASTKYNGWGTGYNDYPAEDQLNWTKYTYYTGKDEYTKITKDGLNRWNKNWTGAEFVMAIDGKYYWVSSVGADLTDDEKKDWAKILTTTDDSIKLDYSYTWGDKSAKTESYGVVTEIYEFKDGGDVTYKYEMKIEDYDEETGKYKQGWWYVKAADEDENPIEGTWTNNNGLIAITFDKAVGIAKAPDCRYTTNIVVEPNLRFWNGKRFGDVTYIGSYWDGDIPDAAKSGEENKDTPWGF